MSDSDIKVRHAQCDCGQLRLTVRGEPVHVHACACTLCQRASGSVMSYSAWFPEEAVTVEGRYTVHHHRGADNPDRCRSFCPVCGTGRFFRSGAAYPNTIAITAGSFAQPDFFPPEFILYWAYRPEWLGAPENITLCPEGAEQR